MFVLSPPSLHKSAARRLLEHVAGQRKRIGRARTQAQVNRALAEIADMERIGASLAHGEHALGQTFLQALENGEPLLQLTNGAAVDGPLELRVRNVVWTGKYAPQLQFAIDAFDADGNPFLLQTQHIRIKSPLYEVHTYAPDVPRAEGQFTFSVDGAEGNTALVRATLQLRHQTTLEPIDTRYAMATWPGGVRVTYVAPHATGRTFIPFARILCGEQLGPYLIRARNGQLYNYPEALDGFDVIDLDCDSEVYRRFLNEPTTSARVYVN
jgi:hypothetical protein